MKIESEKVREMVNEAAKLQRKGEWEEGLKLLREAEKRTESLSENEAKPLKGLIWHYRGRIAQAMGQYNEAVARLEDAILIRKGDPIGYGYSVFQLFICKDYAGYPISLLEIDGTKRALLEMVDASKNPQEIGDVSQNLAYIEQRKGDIEKAIWFYQVAETFRGIANDQRGFALTWARLGECYERINQEQKAREYAEKALGFFKEVGDIERIAQVEAVLAKIQKKEVK